MIDRITEQPFCQTRVSGSTFVNADCFDVFPFIEDKSIDAIICDLPYGTTACKWDTIIPFDKLWKEYERVVKPNGAIVLFGSEPFSSALRMSNIKNYKYDWIWEKTKAGNFQIVKYQPLKYHEIISVFSFKTHNYYPIKEEASESSKSRYKYAISKSKGKLNHMASGVFNYSDGHDKNLKNPSSVIKIKSNTFTEHPTQKPLELMEYLVKTYTNEGDTVLDNTMGSGTTNLACIKLNRKSIGIEKEKQYYDVAVRRASDYLGSNIYKNIQTKENYDKLLSSGMFWEFHPELSGNWDADRSVVQYCH